MSNKYFKNMSNIVFKLDKIFPSKYRETLVCEQDQEGT